MTERECLGCGGLLSIPPGQGRGRGAIKYCDECRSDESAYRALMRKRNQPAIRAYRKFWYEKNRDHAIAYAIRYAQEHPEQRKEWMDANRASVRQWSQRRRARLRNNGVFIVTESDLARLMRRHDSQCAYCAIDLTQKTMTWDHVIPIVRGGQHSIGNLVPACRSCNSSKRDKTITEWRMLQACRLMIGAA